MKKRAKPRRPEAQALARTRLMAPGLFPICPERAFLSSKTPPSNGPFFPARQTPDFRPGLLNPDLFHPSGKRESARWLLSLPISRLKERQGHIGFYPDTALPAGFPKPPPCRGASPETYKRQRRKTLRLPPATLPEKRFCPFYGACNTAPRKSPFSRKKKAGIPSSFPEGNRPLLRHFDARI